MSKIRIVTDSPSDIPKEWIEKYRIGILSAYVNFGPTESIAEVDLPTEDFYKRLPKSNPLPTTAAYSPGEAEALLRKMLDEGAEHIVAIHTNQKISAMYNSTRIAARTIGEDKVTVFDSGSTSMGLGWIALAAAEAAESGADKDEVVRVAASTKERVSLWAVPATMEYLRRSGRVNAMLAGLGEMLQIKPVIAAYNSQVESVARVRTFKKIIPKLVELAEGQAPLERLAVLNLYSPDAVVELRAALQHVAPEGTITVMVTPAIGANLGPEGLGIATVRQK